MKLFINNNITSLAYSLKQLSVGLVFFVVPSGLVSQMIIKTRVFYSCMSCSSRLEWPCLVSKKTSEATQKSSLFEVSDERRKQVWAISVDERQFFERSGHSLDLFVYFLCQDKK